MSKILPAFVASFGVVIFVVNQILQRFLIGPIKEQRRILGEIVQAIRVYSRTDRPPEELNQVSATLRQLANSLQSSCYRIPFYPRLTKMRVVIPEQAIANVSTELIDWSNSLPTGDHEVIAHLQLFADAFQFIVEER